MTELEALAAALQGTSLSQSLRASLWLYPLVNTGHVIGIALLFGAIAPLDLRLMGLWRRVPVAPLADVLMPVAATGIGIAATTGALLFATRPIDYVGEPLFGIKLALIVAALVNVAVLSRTRSWQCRANATRDSRPAWRISAAVSVVLWLGVIAAGRLVGYR